jgi:hypothetical protein
MNVETNNIDSYFTNVKHFHMLCGSVPFTMADCELRRRSPDMEGSCKYIE